MTADVKVCDFGLSSFFYTPTEPGGTPEFLAPEVLIHAKQVQQQGCGPEVDYWAAGILLYYMLSGSTPFQDSNVERILARVRAGRWGFEAPLWKKVSEPAKDLSTRMLQVGHHLSLSSVTFILYKRL